MCSCGGDVNQQGVPQNVVIWVKNRFAVREKINNGDAGIEHGKSWRSSKQISVSVMTGWYNDLLKHERFVALVNDRQLNVVT